MVFDVRNLRLWVGFNRPAVAKDWQAKAYPTKKCSTIFCVH